MHKIPEVIAFAYAYGGNEKSPLYQALCDGLISNIREVMPDREILMLTDENTPAIEGVNSVLRIPMGIPLMTWRLKCHEVAHAVADNILFTEPDVRFQCDMMNEFAGEFDIAVTTRESKVTLDGEDLYVPYTLGVTFSKSQQFWRDAKVCCNGLERKYQDWFGDIMAFAKVIDSGKYNVLTLDGAVFNHVVNDPSEPVTAKALHYKGKRKGWLFDHAMEI